MQSPGRRGDVGTSTCDVFLSASQRRPDSGPVASSFRLRVDVRVVVQDQCLGATDIIEKKEQHRNMKRRSGFNGAVKMKSLRNELQ